MPLKSRITALVVVAVLVLWAAFATLFTAREWEQTRRYHDALLQAQQIAWTKLQAESAQALEATAQQVLGAPAWARAWQDQDRAALGRLLREAVGSRDHWRIDVLDAQRSLVYSTSTDLRQEPMIESGWTAQVLRGDRPELGLSQASRQQYTIVLAQAFEVDGRRGVLALGIDVAHLLPELARMLGGEVFVLNLRGRDVAGTRSEFLASQGLALAVREPRVDEHRAADGRYLLSVLQPLTGPQQRRVGALLMVRDITAERAREQELAAWGIGAGVALLVLLGASVFAYLRYALRPLERSVQVLGALAQGDLRAAPDEDDQALPDEAGQIARGVAALRNEMLNLQMLRDERVRTRQQQERLIRRQLKLLAESLDEASRAEILQALEPERDQADAKAGNDNELAELARILGRMSGLVTTQQDRLVGLLKELRLAMEHQAMLVSLQQELEIARNMQLSILPRQAPSTRAVEVAALMIPAKEVGGDFYDYFLVDDEHLAMVVADVSGKGIPAAFFMAISRTLLKSNALFLREPAQVMAHLNDQLCAENEQMMFVTVFFGVLNLRTGAMDFVNAGHNPPVIREADGTVRLLPRSQNTALAVMEDLPYVQGRIVLQPQDELLLYTDGVTEANDPTGAMFGEQRLLQAVRAHVRGGPDLPQDILRHVRSFEDGTPQADDITCVAVRYVAAS